MPKDFRLVSADVPRKRRNNLYRDILQAFDKGKTASVRVEGTNKKPGTLYIGLTNARKADNAFSSVKITKSGEEVFLSRK